MKITKLGHCCLLIEHKGKRVLTDPGAFSNKQNEEENIDLILITHEHADHLHVESLKQVLEKNPTAQIVTNNGVGKLLDEQNIKYTLLVDTQSTTVQEIFLEAFGTKHAEIYKEFGAVENTGYFIDNKLFYPGDAFTNPKKDISILALPVEGPWMSLKEAVEYAKLLKPDMCFPVHDGRLQESRIGASHLVPQKMLAEVGISFIPLKECESFEVDDE